MSLMSKGVAGEGGEGRTLLWLLLCNFFFLSVALC